MSSYKNVGQISSAVLGTNKQVKYIYTGLSTKDKIAKTTCNLLNMMIMRIVEVFCSVNSHQIAFFFNKEGNKIIVAQNHKYQEIDSINFAQSSLKSID